VPRSEVFVETKVWISDYGYDQTLVHRSSGRPVRLRLVVVASAGTSAILCERPRSARQEDGHHAEGGPSEDEQDHGDDAEHGGCDPQPFSGHEGTLLGFAIGGCSPGRRVGGWVRVEVFR
jgi:hypothetical protein